MRPQGWPHDFLVDYIVHNHHQYIKNTTPELLKLMAKVVKVHGDAHPELFEIAGIFNPVAEELIMHMRKEEQMLFPGIKALAHHDGKDNINLPLKFIRNPIMMMEEDHAEAGEGMETIREVIILPLEVPVALMFCFIICLKHLKMTCINMFTLKQYPFSQSH